MAMREDSRQDFDFIQDTVVEVLVEMGFMSEPAARNWCEKATEPTRSASKTLPSV